MDNAEQSMQTSHEHELSPQKPSLRVIEGDLSTPTEQEERISSLINELSEINPGYAEKMSKSYSEIVGLIPACLKGFEGKLNQEEQQHLNEGILKRAEEILTGSIPYERRLSFSKSRNIGNLTEEIGINPEGALNIYKTYLRAYFNLPDGVEDLRAETEKMLPHMDKILYLCDVYGSKGGDLLSIPKTFREAMTLDEVLKSGSEEKPDVGAVRDEFYKEYQEMNDKASETTGDTVREKARLFDFVKKAIANGGTILDGGCGDGTRMTEPLSKFLKREDIQAEVIGIDSLQSDHSSKTGTEYLKGEITDMRGQVADQSVDVVVNNWSVVNDLTEREDQNKALSEYARVLKSGGYLYLDVPWLEGGEGSYEEEAKEYREEHPNSPYGTVEIQFSEGEDLQSKNFYIYPRLELFDFLRENGFEVVNGSPSLRLINIQNNEELHSSKDFRNDPLISSAWRTRSGKPRITIIAQKTGEAPSSLASRKGYPTHS